MNNLNQSPTATPSPTPTETINSAVWENQPFYAVGAFTCPDGYLWPSMADYIKAKGQQVRNNVSPRRTATPLNFAAVMALAAR